MLGTLLSLVIMVVLSIAYVIGASTALVNTADLSSTGEVSFEEDTMEGVTIGGIVITAIFLAFNLFAIIFTGLFIWGNDCWNNEKKRNILIVLSSLTFLIGVAIIVGVLATRCYVTDPTKLGNGICDFGEYDSKTCRYDFGDCTAFNEVQAPTETFSTATSTMATSSSLSTSTTTSTTTCSTLDPSTLSACVDTPNYLDMYGGACAEYELPGNEAWCRGYGSDGEEGMTPNENCCVCKTLFMDNEENTNTNTMATVDKGPMVADNVALKNAVNDYTSCLDDSYCDILFC